MNGIKLCEPPAHVKRLVESIGGTIEASARLPDGSGFCTMTTPLPKDHWLTKDPDDFNVPPMPFRMGTLSAPVLNRDREMWRQAILKAARYAIRAATMNGKYADFDPDAMAGNFVIGMIGYHTETGLSSDDFANPKL